MATLEPVREEPLSENLDEDTTWELGIGGGGAGCLQKALYPLPELEWGVKC